MLCYKLTDKDMKAYGGFQWEIGREFRIENKSVELCSNAYFHFYYHPVLAVLLNCINTNIQQPRLWECETGGQTLNLHYLKGGCKIMTLIKEIDIPVLSKDEKIKFTYNYYHAKRPLGTDCAKWYDDAALYYLQMATKSTHEDLRCIAKSIDISTHYSDILNPNLLEFTQDFCKKYLDVAL